MKHFWKHLGQCMIWLLLSEILCLILAVSAAILPHNFIIRLLGLLCGVLAHMLLMGSCARKAADEDAVCYRTEGIRTKPLKPLLTALLSMCPAAVLYLMLLCNQNSILLLNLFPLLNAPFLQIYRLLIADTEPFAAVSSARKMLMALPPLLTAASWYIGYTFRYMQENAKTDARTSRS